eukprot:1158503-Pelagomonas_calceolata.AAC.11
MEQQMALGVSGSPSHGSSVFAAEKPPHMISTGALPFRFNLKLLNDAAQLPYNPPPSPAHACPAGLNPREALARSSGIMHSPSALLDGGAPRPLSACDVHQANAHLARVQQQQAVRACAQWATNEDAVLERTAPPAPGRDDTQQGEGETRKEPGDARDGEVGVDATCAELLLWECMFRAWRENSWGRWAHEGMPAGISCDAVIWML